MFISCSINRLHATTLPQEQLSLITINPSKIMIHERYVASAQNRYRYVKPLLTTCGVTFILGYFWYTSSSLSNEEINRIRNFIAQNKQQNVFRQSWLDWSKSNVSSIGGVAVELIGGALIIPPLADLVGTLTGCAYTSSSLEIYDQKYTHCNELIMQMARDLQICLASQASGKQVVIGIPEIVNAYNRLVKRMEKLLGFMRVESKKFVKKTLQQEAGAIELRLIYYSNELYNDMNSILDKKALDYKAILELIIQFAQRYAQEVQRFVFLEQDASSTV